MNQPLEINRRNMLKVLGKSAAAIVAWRAGLLRSPYAAAIEPELVEPQWKFPLKVSSNRRYLTDQNGSPFLLAGDAPQAMIVKLNLEQAASYIANRCNYGFNAMWINLLCAAPYFPSCNKDGSTVDGIRPFTGYLTDTHDLAHYDLTKPNGAYFTRAQQMLDLLAPRGLVVFLDPIETGQWLQTLRNNGRERCRAYGEFLGRRFATLKNMVWLNGNDFGSWAKTGDDAVVQAVAEGIKKTAPESLQTVELLGTPSLRDPSWAKIISINSAYTYGPTYQQMLQNFNHRPRMPSYLLEAHYELENVGQPPDYGTAAVVRRQAYWTMLSGGCGQFYGNHYIWGFFPNWESHLNTPGAAEFTIWKNFFSAIPWYTLIPDQAHRVVIAGLGDYGNSRTRVSADNYCTAAVSSFGTTMVAYAPTFRTITVNMAAFQTPMYAHWFDPTNGNYTAISGTPFKNSGNQQFTPPIKNHSGSSDWVLLLERKQN